MRRLSKPNPVMTLNQLQALAKKELIELIKYVNLNERNLDQFSKSTLVDIANYVLNQRD